MSKIIEAFIGGFLIPFKAIFTDPDTWAVIGIFLGLITLFSITIMLCILMYVFIKKHVLNRSHADS